MGVSLPKWQGVWLGSLWALISVAAVCSLLLPHSFLLTAIGDGIQCILLSSFVVAACLNLRGPERRTRLFWTLVTVSAALWLLTQLLWTHSELFLRHEVPNPFIGDIVLFLHLVPLMAAMAVRPDVDRGQQSRRLGSLDFLLLLCFWLFLYLFVVIPWQYVALDEKAYGFAFDTLYFTEHLVLLVAIAVVWRDSSGSWRRIYGALFAASGLYALSAAAAGVGIDFGSYYTGSFYDMPLYVGILLFTQTALVSHASEQTEPLKNESKANRWISAMAMAVAGSLPLFALWAVLFSQAPIPVRSFRLLLTLATIVLMGGLRSWKQFALDDELGHANQELLEASFTDVLTGVRNRRFLATTIDNDVRLVLRSYSSAAASNKNHNRDLIFYLIDVDHFKFINDAFGHDQGDDLLVQIAGRISSAIRYSDVLIRWGGEEFLVVSRNTSRHEADALAARVLASVGTEPFRLTSGQSIRRTCSIGWAVFPWLTAEPEAIGYEQILRMADHALYQAKEEGRNRAIGLLPQKSSEPSERAHDPSQVKSLARRLVTEGPSEAESLDTLIPDESQLY